MKKNRLKWLIAILIIVYPSWVFAKLSCPPINDGSFLTKNNNGNSAYFDRGITNFFSNTLPNRFRIKISGPALDIGAGYGAVTSSLMQYGIRNITANDLDSQNLACLKAFLAATYKKDELSNISYVTGDITKNSVSKNIKDNYFSVAIANNVLHFFNESQLIDFAKIMNKKIRLNGYLIINIENLYLSKETELLMNIYFHHVLNPANTLDQYTEAYYSAHALPVLDKRYGDPKNTYCSSKDYHNAPKDLKMPGFPCDVDEGHVMHSLILPASLEILMRSAGFKLIKGGVTNPEGLAKETFIFQKVKSINDKQFLTNIKSGIKAYNDKIQGYIQKNRDTEFYFK